LIVTAMSSTFIVKNTRDSGQGSLRQAILDASLTPEADSVVFDSRVFRVPRTIRLRSELVVNTDLKLIGPGTARLTLSGDRDGNGTNNLGDVAIFLIRSGTISISQLTIADGRAQGQDGSPGNGGGAAGMGGGLFINDGNVTLQNVVLRNNQATGGNGGKSFGLEFKGGGGKGGDSSIGPGGLGGGSLSGLPPNGLNGFFGAGGGGATNVSAFGVPNFYYGLGGKGGFGGGGGSFTRGIKYYGPFLGGTAGLHGSFGNEFQGGSGAGLGGAIFIRSGTLTLENTKFFQNFATGGALADGKGGAIYVLDTLNNENPYDLDPNHPNNQGMPVTLPKVFTWQTTFYQNSATNANGTTPMNGIGNNQDNGDVYGSIFKIKFSPILRGTTTSDRLVGTTANETFLGLTGNDTLVGQGGDDALLGMNGTDILLSGAGDDLLSGGKGTDTLVGGPGADCFVFSGQTFDSALSNSTFQYMDHIRNINVARGDKFCIDADNNFGTASLPRALFNARSQNARSLKEAVTGAYLDKNYRQIGKQALTKNEAVFFTWRGQYFLSVNDSQAGFSSQTDLLVKMSGQPFSPGERLAGTLKVTNYFQ
jgi:hypothetical protein